MADPFIIETAELRKQYDGIEALRGLNLQVPAGSIYGFLGRNGAGKTTTLKILLGMTRPTSGQARVFRPRRVWTSGVAPVLSAKRRISTTT